MTSTKKTTSSPPPFDSTTAHPRATQEQIDSLLFQKPRDELTAEERSIVDSYKPDPKIENFSNVWYQLEKEAIDSAFKSRGLTSTMKAGFTVRWLAERYQTTDAEILKYIIESANNSGLRHTAATFRFRENQTFPWLEDTGNRRLTNLRRVRGAKGVIRVSNPYPEDPAAIWINEKRLGERWLPFKYEAPLGVETFESFLLKTVRSEARKPEVQNLVRAAVFMQSQGQAVNEFLCFHKLLGALFSLEKVTAAPSILISLEASSRLWLLAYQYVSLRPRTQAAPNKAVLQIVQQLSPTKTHSKFEKH